MESTGRGIRSLHQLSEKERAQGKRHARRGPAGVLACQSSVLPGIIKHVFAIPDIPQDQDFPVRGLGHTAAKGSAGLRPFKEQSALLPGYREESCCFLLHILATTVGASDRFVMLSKRQYFFEGFMTVVADVIVDGH